MIGRRDILAGTAVLAAIPLAGAVPAAASVPDPAPRPRRLGPHELKAAAARFAPKERGSAAVVDGDALLALARDLRDRGAAGEADRLEAILRADPARSTAGTAARRNGQSAAEWT